MGPDGQQPKSLTFSMGLVWFEEFTHLESVKLLWNNTSLVAQKKLSEFPLPRYTPVYLELPRKTSPLSPCPYPASVSELLAPAQVSELKEKQSLYSSQSGLSLLNQYSDYQMKRNKDRLTDGRMDRLMDGWHLSCQPTRYIYPVRIQ